MSTPDDLIMAGTNGVLGFELDEATPDRVVLSWTVDDRHRQPYGIVHGGVYCAAVETAGSVGAALWFNEQRFNEQRFNEQQPSEQRPGEGGQVVGVANHTNFLRAVRDGRLVATATPIHRGASQQLWLIEVRDQDDRVAARGELRLQNLPPRAADGAK